MLAHLIPFAPVAIVLLLAWRQLPRARTGRVLREEIARHRATLRGKFLKAHDEYGSFHADEWEGEVAYFLDSVVLPKLSREPSDREHARLVRRASKLALDAIASADAAAENRADPLEFEHRCAAILRASGWDANVSGGSGDQGADVIASGNGQTLVVQCKRWSKPIGNKAVQEAAAARSYYRAQMAAVVGTAPFTESAHELADATDVLLLDEAGLAELAPPFGR